MNKNMLLTRDRWSLRLTRLVVASAILMSHSGAFASLGGSLDSVQADRARMNATIHLTSAQTYTVHELTNPHGTIIREYVSTAGVVFGVAWQGPFLPEMRHLLGSYFPHFSSAARSQHASHVGRRFLIIHDPDLVVETGGRMLSYYGRAFDPGLLPQGVTGDDIR